MPDPKKTAGELYKKLYDQGFNMGGDKDSFVDGVIGNNKRLDNLKKFMEKNGFNPSYIDSSVGNLYDVTSKKKSVGFAGSGGSAPNFAQGLHDIVDETKNPLQQDGGVDVLEADAAPTPVPSEGVTPGIPKGANIQNKNVFTKDGMLSWMQSDNDRRVAQKEYHKIVSKSDETSAVGLQKLYQENPKEAQQIFKGNNIQYDGGDDPEFFSKAADLINDNRAVSIVQSEKEGASGYAKNVNSFLISKGYNPDRLSKDNKYVGVVITSLKEDEQKEIDAAKKAVPVEYLYFADNRGGTIKTKNTFKQDAAVEAVASKYAMTRDIVGTAAMNGLAEHGETDPYTLGMKKLEIANPTAYKTIKEAKDDAVMSQMYDVTAKATTGYPALLGLGDAYKNKTGTVAESQAVMDGFNALLHANKGAAVAEDAKKLLQQKKDLEIKYPEARLAEIRNKIGYLIRENQPLSSIWQQNSTSQVNEAIKQLPADDQSFIKELSKNNPSGYPDVMKDAIIVGRNKGDMFGANIIPTGGALNAVRKSVGQSVSSLGDLVDVTRGDDERRYEGLSEPYRNETLGESPYAQELKQLMDKKEDGDKLSEEQEGRLSDLKTFASELPTTQRFVNGTLNITTQVLVNVLLTKGFLGVEKWGMSTGASVLVKSSEVAKGLRAAEGAADLVKGGKIAEGTVGVARGTDIAEGATELAKKFAALKARSNAVAGAAEWMKKGWNAEKVYSGIVGGALTYESAAKRGATLFDGESGAWFKTRTYAILTSLGEAFSESIFRNTKTWDAFKKDLRVPAAAIAREMYVGKITKQALRGRIAGLANTIYKYAGHVAVENNKEMWEEVASQLNQSMWEGVLAYNKFDKKEAMDDIVSTGTTMFLHGWLAAGMAGIKDVRTNKIHTAMWQQVANDGGLAGQVRQEVNRQHDNGEITTEDFNEKNLVLNSLVQASNDNAYRELMIESMSRRNIAEDVKNQDVSDEQNKKADDLFDKAGKYLAVATNDLVLRKKYEESTSASDKAGLQKQIDANNKIKEGLAGGKLTLDAESNVVETPKKEKQKEDDTKQAQLAGSQKEQDEPKPDASFEDIVSGIGKQDELTDNEKAKTEVPKSSAKAGVTDEGNDKNIKPTEERKGIKEEVGKYIDEVNSKFRPLLSEGSDAQVAENLKGVAEQAGSSKIEREGAVNNFGENIVNIAEREFPDAKASVKEGGDLDLLEKQLAKEDAATAKAVNTPIQSKGNEVEPTNVSIGRDALKTTPDSSTPTNIESETKNRRKTLDKGIERIDAILQGETNPQTEKDAISILNEIARFRRNINRGNIATNEEIKRMESLEQFAKEQYGLESVSLLGRTFDDRNTTDVVKVETGSQKDGASVYSDEIRPQIMKNGMLEQRGQYGVLQDASQQEVDNITKIEPKTNTQTDITPIQKNAGESKEQTVSTTRPKEEVGENDNSYKGSHQLGQFKATADDLTKGGTGFDWETVAQDHDLSDKPTKESYRILKGIKDNPDAEVTIYRAVPKDVNKINDGDWVTLSKTYAKEHGMDESDASKDNPVISQKVKAKDLAWDGNDLNEFAYKPEEPKQELNLNNQPIGDVGEGTYSDLQKQNEIETSKEDKITNQIETHYKSKGVPQDVIDQLLVYGKKVTSDFKDIMPEAAKSYDNSIEPLHNKLEAATSERTRIEGKQKDKILNDINVSFREMGVKGVGLKSVSDFFNKLIDYSGFDALSKRLKFNKFNDLKKELVFKTYKAIAPNEFRGVDKYEDIPEGIRDHIEKTVDGAMSKFKGRLINDNNGKDNGEPKQELNLNNKVPIEPGTKNAGKSNENTATKTTTPTPIQKDAGEQEGQDSKRNVPQSADGTGQAEAKGEAAVQYLARNEDSPEAKSHNINTAKDMLRDLGVAASFSGYSDTNGVSVYFADSAGKKYRVSNHSVTSKSRMDNETLLYFDARQLGLGGKISVKSNVDNNIRQIEKQQPKEEIKPLSTVESKIDEQKQFISTNDIKGEFKDARYSKGNIAFHPPVLQKGAFKSREHRLAEGKGISGKWSNREKAYIMSKGQAERLKKYIKEGYDAEVMTGKIIPPEAKEGIPQFQKTEGVDARTETMVSAIEKAVSDNNGEGLTLDKLKNKVAGVVKSNKLDDLVEDAYNEFSKRTIVSHQDVDGNPIKNELTSQVSKRIANSFSKMFGGYTGEVFTIVKNSDAVVKATQGSDAKFMGHKGKILGAIVTDKNGVPRVILNGEQVNGNTAIHEAAGHILMDWYEKNNPGVFEEGLKKVIGSKYLSRVQNSTFYKGLAEQYGKEGSKEYDRYMQKEALAMAIGDSGGQFFTESKRNGFKEWAKKLWQSVGKFFGIEGKTSDEISKMSLDEFSKHAAAQLLDPDATFKSIVEDAEKRKAGKQRQPERGEGDRITSNRNADTKVLRDEFGLGDRNVSPETLEQWDAQAKERLAVPGALKELVQSIKDGRYNAGGAEESMFRISIEEAAAKARETLSPRDINDLHELIKASEMAGKAAGSDLRARRRNFAELDPLMQDLIEKKEALSTDELSEEQIKEVKDVREDIDKKQKAFDDVTEPARNKKIQEARNEAAKKALGKRKKAKKMADAQRNSQITKAKAALEALAIKRSKAKFAAEGEPNVRLQRIDEESAPLVMDIVDSLTKEGKSIQDIAKESHEILSNYFDEITPDDVLDVMAGMYDVRATKLQLKEQELNHIRLLDRIKKFNKIKKKHEESEGDDRKQYAARLSHINDEIAGLGAFVNSNYSIFGGKKFSVTGQEYNEGVVESNLNIIKSKIKDGDYAEAAIPPVKVKYTKEQAAAKRELIEAQVDKEIQNMKDSLASEYGYKKYKNIVLSSANFTRALTASFDFSGLGRQGKIVVYTHPFIAAKAGIAGVKAMSLRSSYSYDEWFHDLKERDNYRDYISSELALSDVRDPDLSKQEEMFASNYANVIPGVKQSERGYTIVLNDMRVSLFDMYADRMRARGLTMTNSLEQYKAMASYVNTITGRGNVPKWLESAAPTLNAILFSPRLMFARLRFLTYFANPYFYRKMPKEIRVAYVKDLGKTVAAGFIRIALEYAAISAYKAVADPDDDKNLEVGTEPGTANWGKIVYDDTHVDMWGGFQQYVRMFAAAYNISTEIKKRRDEDKSTYGLNVLDPVGKSLRYKLSPTSAIAYDYFIAGGESAIGEKIVFGLENPITGDMIFGKEPRERKREISLGKYAAGHVIPFSLMDTYEALRDKGALRAAYVLLHSEWGNSANTYKETKTKKKQKQSDIDSAY